MKVGDLIGIGWHGVRREPFVAVIKKVHKFCGEPSGFTVFIPATGKETFIIPEDVKPVKI